MYTDRFCPYLGENKIEWLGTCVSESSIVINCGLEDGTVSHGLGITQDREHIKSIQRVVFQGFPVSVSCFSWLLMIYDPLENRRTFRLPRLHFVKSHHGLLPLWLWHVTLPI